MLIEGILTLKSKKKILEDLENPVMHLFLWYYRFLASYTTTRTNYFKTHFVIKKLRQLCFLGKLKLLPMIECVKKWFEICTLEQVSGDKKTQIMLV